MVIIMTARPSPEVSIAGFASCLQCDQHYRCTVGQFNWVPDVFDTLNPNSDNAIRSDRHTATHEIAHLLGAVLLGSSRNVIDEKGNRLSAEEFAPIVVDESEHYKKSVNQVNTTRVLSTARSQLNCESLEGVTVEDVELGAAAHWESRILGPEFMSYGGASGEVYISDLTLAFLEDTNQFRVNYSNAGLLVQPTEVSFRLGGPLFLARGTVTREEPPEPDTPGTLTWGKMEGCTFVKGSARNWPAQYNCFKHQEFGCTPDNKNSAVCTLNWELLDDGVDSCYWDEENREKSCTSFSGELPKMYQYFSSDEVATALTNVNVDVSKIKVSNLGGFSRSMDYVSVQVKFWNCRDVKSSLNTSSKDDTGLGIDLGGIAGSILPDMERFGGQEHCATCRCFESSLRELTSFAFSPKFPKFGLCYRANCFRRDYLQVAVRNQLGGVSWYKCPQNGGKIYLAGFTGALHCPDAVAFCKHEEITGIKYPETNPVVEFVVFSVLGGVALAFLCIGCGPNWRENLITWCKRRCGVIQFDLRSRKKKTPELFVPEKRTGLAMLLLNGLVLSVGIILLFMAIYGMAEGIISTSAIPLVTGGIFAMVIALIGMVSGLKVARGPSCCTVAFFYITLGVVLSLLWFLLYLLAFPDSWEEHAKDNLELYRDMFPNQVDDDATTDQQAQQLAEFLKRKSVVIINGGFVVLAVYLMNLGLTVRVLGPRSLVATNYTLLNNVLWILGLLTFAIGTAFAALQGSFATEDKLPELIMAVGGIATVAGMLGTIGAFKKNLFLCTVNVLILLGLLGVMIASVVIAFQRSEQIKEEVKNMSAEEKRQIGEDMGFATLSDQQLEEELEQALRRIGMSFAVSIILVLLLLISGIFYLKYAKEWKTRVKRVEIRSDKEKATGRAEDINGVNGKEDQ
eukprot:gb/GECG01015807.1/.p1 GENE.gb/GECG01015807.1/~~gb/GECG01015807.1/.p1  ORF type:complete len:909 (+),score=86.63 gb/GECG01015807.1/:1-2727(+)